MPFIPPLKQESAPVSAGFHHLVCIGVIDLGHQWSPKYDKFSHRVMLAFEVADELIDVDRDGVKRKEPRTMSSTYGLTFGSKSELRKLLEGWRGRAFTDNDLAGFDLSKLIGQNGYSQIVHNSNGGKIYANIASIGQLPKNLAKVQPYNKTLYWYFAEQPKPYSIPEHFWPWLKEKLMASQEWKTQNDQPAPAADQSADAAREANQDGPVDDNIPF